MSNFFSNSQPDLIGMKTMNDLVDMVIDKDSEKLKDVIPIKKPVNGLSSFINNFIKPNLLPIILIVLFVGFLLFRYFSVKEERFNPAAPVDAQINRASYVDVNLPVIYDSKELEDVSDEDMLRRMKKKEKPFEKSPYINPDDYHSSEEREQVIYGTDVWMNEPDAVPNPFYDNNYVTSTSDAVNFATEKNKKSLNAAARMMFD